MNPTLFFISVFLCLQTTLFAQEEDTTEKEKPVIHFGAYFDSYFQYRYNFESGRDYYFSGLRSNYTSRNQLNINLAVLRADLQHSRYRGTLAVQEGTFARMNNKQYSSSGSGSLSEARFIYEAHAGFALNKKGNLWADAGIFPSHIGAESPNAFDNITLTRSLSAENSPYFLGGAKLTYALGEHWVFIGTICNGWNTLQVARSPAFGTAVTYKNEKISVSWNTFAGNRDDVNNALPRYYNDIYMKWKSGRHWNFIATADIGSQRRISKNVFDSWYNFNLSAQYRINSKNAVAMRAEWISDKEQTYFHFGPIERIYAASLNFDYCPVSRLLWRAEARILGNADGISYVGINNYELFFTTSLSFRFSK